jgi:hypothetical protein
MNARRCGIAILTLLILHSHAALADQRIHGQVTDATSGNPVRSAWVRADREPVDGAYEADVLTDTFGFYGTEGLAAGTYRVTAGRPGYAPASNTVVVATGPRVLQSFELTPLLPGGGNDIVFEVQCVTSTLRLEGVPVEAQVFAQPSNDTPWLVRSAVTDTNGVATLQGMPDAYYRFRANQGGSARPKWLAFSTEGQPADKAFVTQYQSVRIGLKPEAQEITFTVRGLRPAHTDRFTDTNQPLTGVYVELTGVDFDATGNMSELVPTRTGVTDQDGEVTFRGLPAISWFARTKRLGYWPYEAAINPHPTTGELIDTHTLRPALRSNKMWLVLKHPYADRDVLHTLRMRVQGLEDTNTTGIDFENTWYYFWNGTHYFEWHTLYNMLPGRYKLTVNGHGAGNGKIRPDFFATDYVEIEDKTNTNPNVTWTSASLDLETVPATIRGRLFAADNISQFHGVIGTQFSEPTPAYRQVREQAITIEFKEFEGQDPADGPFLKPQFRTVTVMTDTNGEFTVSLPSAHYGLRIPGMTDHWGSHVSWRNFTTSHSIEKGKTQGWPFCRWPHASLPPANGTSEWGYPIPVRSGHEYLLDVYVRKQIMAVSGWVFDDSNDPTPGDLVLGSGTDRGQVTLQKSGGSAVTKPLKKQRTGNGHEYLFLDVEPGDHTLSVAHARNTFTYGGTGTPFNVTIPTWDPPGVVPTNDPNHYVIHPFGEIKLANVQAAYTPSATTVEFIPHRWDPVDEEYDTLGTTSYFGSKQVDYIGEMRFGSGIPQGGFTLWKTVYTTGGGRKYFEKRIGGEGGTHSFDIYYGGGTSDNVINELPDVPTDIEFHVYSDADPTYFVPDTSVELDDGDPFDAFPILFQEYEVVSFPGKPTVTGISNAYWTGTSTKRVIDAAVPRYRIDLIMKRGTRFTGTVVNASSSLPISRAKVEIRDRFGNVLRDALTTTNGTFDFPQHISGSETIYADFTAYGYLPSRQRFDPGAGIIVPDPDDPDDKAVMTINQALTPVPAPTVIATDLDRHGMFLPGITRVGDTELKTGGQATQELTLAWSLTLDATTYNYELPPFDEADGTEPTPVSVAAADTITDVWLVDPRMYGTPAMGTNAAVYGNPYSDTNTPVLLPTAADYHGVRDWLSGLGGDAAPGVFFAQADSIAPVPGPNRFKASGTVPLWKLPPGDFIPRFVVLTERGAVRMHTVNYAGPLNGKDLVGQRVPPWLAVAADAMGAIAANGPVVDQVASYMPKGRFAATPKFQAQIGPEPGHPGFIRYFYRIGMNVAESMDTPGNDIVGLGPGSLGLDFEASADVTASGRNRSIALAIQGDAIITNAIDVTEYTPPFLAPWKPQVDIVEPDAHIRSELGKTFPGGGPYEWELTHQVWGGIGVEAQLNLRPITGKLPYVGPALITLDRTGGLSIFGDLDARVDLASRRTWRTLFPPPTGSTVGDPRVWSRHFLGGTEDLNLPPLKTNKFDLAFNFGVGLSVELARGRAGAGGKLRLAGNEHPITGRPSLVVALNPDGDWPPIKRISGKAFAELNAYLDAWIVRWEEDWQWEIAAFDIQLGTESTFALAPVTRTLRSYRPDGQPAATFIGETPIVLQHGYRMLRHGSVSAGTNAMVYTDGTGGSNMALRIALQLPDGTWSAPHEVATAPGFVAVAVAPIDSGFMALWSEVTSADVGNPYPGSTVRWATSGHTADSWSAPGTLMAFSNSVASDVFLPYAEMPSATVQPGIVFTTAGGPTSMDYDIHSATWDDAADTWSTATQSATNVNARGIALGRIPTVATSRVAIATTTEDNAVEIRIATGNAIAPPVTLATGISTPAVGVMATTNDSVWVGWCGSGVNITEYDWLLDQVPGTSQVDSASAGAGEIVLRRVGDRLLVAWTSPTGKTIAYRRAGLGGTPTGSVVRVVENAVGVYRRLRATSLPDDKAALSARYQDAVQTELRQFIIDLNQEGKSPDSDGDGILDADELVIVDADPTDAIDGLEDVTPESDFDGDGMKDKDEFDLGFDPADSRSRFEIEMSLEDDTLTTYLPGRSDLEYYRATNINHLVFSNAIHQGRERLAAASNVSGTVTLPFTNPPPPKTFIRARAKKR